MNAALALILLSAAVLAAQALPTADQQWEAFKSVYGHKFSDIEAKKEQFLAAKAGVDRHNAEADQGLHTYWKQVNHFAIMTEEEEQMRTVATIAAVSGSQVHTHATTNVTVPRTLDLRTGDKCLAPIKDQGECKASHAFAAIAPLEYQYCTGYRLSKPVIFSEQQLVDCNTDSGCSRTDLYHEDLVYDDYRYLQNNTIMRGTEYPYVSGQTSEAGTCQYDAGQVAPRVAYTKISWDVKPETIKQLLAIYGPVSARVDASADFRAYKSGVFGGTCPMLGSYQYVNIVGYGNLLGTEYWIVRNSYGALWGEMGYIRMKAGINLCGIEDKITWVALF